MEAVDTWNFFADHYKLPKIIKLTDVRKRKLQKRLADPDFNLEKILRQVEKSDFLLGRTKENWLVNFDFIIHNDSNYVKIMEGKYNGRDRKSDHQDELTEILETIANDPDLQ